MSSRVPRASGYFRTSYGQELALLQTRTERVSLVALLAVLLIYPFIVSAFYLDLATQVFLASIGSLSLMLLTGYADKENAVKAINEVGLYQYIEKPWRNEDLKLIIQNGLERRFLMEQLEQKIKEVQSVQRSLQDIQAQIIKAFM